MARYVYSQESGDDFKVNSSDKCDAQEDSNEVRQILDDLGDLLGHTKFDDSYPKDVTAGGTLGYVKKSNFASTSNPAVSDDSTTGYAVGSRWINTATDIEYVCLDSSTGAAIWVETTVDTFLELTDTPADFLLDASKLLRVNSSSGAVEFVSTTGIATDTFGLMTDITTNNATTGLHGFLPKLTSVATDYLSATGGYTAPAGVGNVISSGDFTAGTLAEISSSGDTAIQASPFTVTTGDVMDFGLHAAGFTEQQIATTTGTAAINWNSGNKALFTRSTGAAGAATFTFTAPVKSANLTLIIRGSTAGSTGTITWPTVYWQGGSVPTLTGTANAIDTVAFYYSTGLTVYLGLGSANFSTV